MAHARSMARAVICRRRSRCESHARSGRPGAALRRCTDQSAHAQPRGRHAGPQLSHALARPLLNRAQRLSDPEPAYSVDVPDDYDTHYSAAPRPRTARPNHRVDRNPAVKISLYPYRHRKIVRKLGRNFSLKTDAMPVASVQRIRRADIDGQEWHSECWVRKLRQYFGDPHYQRRSV